MSAMSDSCPRPVADEANEARYPAFRDLLLALSLTVLAALAMQASGAPVPNGPDDAPVVRDWKGNSGSLPAAPHQGLPSVKSASTG